MISRLPGPGTPRRVASFRSAAAGPGRGYWPPRLPPRAEKRRCVLTINPWPFDDEVYFAIHPVVGSMPSHMSVLLAGTNVPYANLLARRPAIMPSSASCAARASAAQSSFA